MKYANMTTEQLIKTASWVDVEAEATAEEKANAKQMIKCELLKRFAAVIEFIDDGQNATNPAGTFDRLING